MSQYEIKQLAIEKAEQAEKEAKVERLSDALEAALDDAYPDRNQPDIDDGHYGL